MNFYKRYMGDYLRDTLRLSMTEDGAGKVWHLPITAIARFECLVGHTLMTQWIERQRELILDDEMRELFEAEQRAAELRAKFKAKAAKAA